MNTDQEPRPVRADEPLTVMELLRRATDYFVTNNVEFPQLDAQLLLAHALGCDKIDLFVRHDQVPGEETRRRFRELVRRRIEGCPVAYLRGWKEFFSLKLDVSPAVLIPRPDTETLVVECLRLIKPLEAPAVLDIGAGSGAIAVAVAKHHPTARVVATDISAEALAVARHNARQHAVDARIRFLEGDLFATLTQADVFDVIVSNPPYIPTEELPRLEPGVRHYEPLLALDGGPGGFQVIQRLIDNARQHLKPGGCLLVEIGAPQEAVVRDLLEKRGYELAPTIRDYSHHPRVLKATWRP